MFAKARYLMLGTAALLVVGLMTSAAAWGSETEAPFWNVAGKRLEAEKSKTASIKNVAGIETILHVTIKTAKAEIRCKTSSFEEASVEGSASKQDGKASSVLGLSECKLFVQEGAEYKEQTGCEVASIKSVKLAAKLWLEGTKAAGGTRTVLVFEPKELTEGKPLIANVVINKETCTYKGTYSLEGSFAAKLLPEDEEFPYIQWAFPTTPITTAWQPPSQEGETSVGLKFSGSTASLQGEDKAELTSKEKFGGGVAPLAGIEAPFWVVGGKRLEAESEKEAVLASGSSSAVFHSTVKGVETETRCAKSIVIEVRIIGSLNQHDGKIVIIIEFSECKLFAKEGGKFVEQPKCEVTPIRTNKLDGRLWLEGTPAGRSEKPLIVLEPENLTEGKPVMMEQTVRNKGGETCTLAVEKYKMEGNLAAQLKPENKQSAVLTLVFPPKPPENAWQSAEQQAEIKIKLEAEGKTIILEVEINIELVSKEKFGGGVGNTGAGLRWLAGGRSLEQPYETRALESEGGVFKLKVTGATIVCGKVKATGEIIGGTPGTDKTGKIEFSECDIEGASKCEINKGKEGAAIITTEPIKTTLEYKAKSKKGEVLDLFEPATGKALIKIEFGKKCPIFEGETAEVTGSLLGELWNGKMEAAKEGMEEEKGFLAFPESELKEFENQSEKTEKSELKLGGKAATLVGKTEVKLVSKEIFGWIK
jgi:hypothetical protein